MESPLLSLLSPNSTVANSSAVWLIAPFGHQIMDLHRIDEVVCNEMPLDGLETSGL